MSARNFNIKHITLFEITGYLKKFFLRYSIVLLMLIALCLMFLSWQNNSQLNRMTNATRDQLVAVISLLDRARLFIADQVVIYHEFTALQAKYGALKRENQQLQHQNNRAIQLLEENKQLKNLLSYTEHQEQYLLTTRIIGNLTTPYQRFALINAGETSAVEKNQIVTSNNNLIGRIIKTGKHQAELLLITDLSSNIPFLTNNSRERGIAIGNNSDYLNVKYLPEDSKAAAGELVITSGDGEFFPANIPIGYLVATPENKLLIKPLIDWSRLEFVQIIQKGKLVNTTPNVLAH